jgi:hypothetical protein
MTPAIVEYVIGERIGCQTGITHRNLRARRDLNPNE